MQQFDVVIIGGGLVGATLANVLLAQNKALKLAVVEAHQFNQTLHPSFDDRSIALAADSVAYLAEYDLFDPQVNYASAIKQVHVSDKGHFGKTHIHHHDYHIDALGYVVEVKPWGHSLNARLVHTSCTQFCPATVTDITPRSDGNALTLNDGTALNAKLVVIADGAQSPTRQLVHIGFDSTPYKQSALIANVGVAGDHQGQAYERFSAHGPLALLPMSQSRYSLVWCDDAEKLTLLKDTDNAAFLAALQDEFGYRAGEFMQVGERSVYPLSLGRAQSLHGNHCVVMGNAAHAVHPIAGQGFNLGLRDIKQLAWQVSQTDLQQLGSYAFTQAYAQARQSDINRVMQLTDALVRGFSNDSRMLALTRSLGLSAMHGCSRLRHTLAKQLMGFNN